MSRNDKNDKKLRHVMINIETMGRTPDSAIVSIGAVIFDPRFNKVSDETFYVELAWKDQNRFIEKETQDWWKEQSAETKKSLYGKGDLSDVLDDLEFFLPKDVRVWGNGPSFDIAFLEHAYKSFCFNIPWEFWNVRDCRTVRDMYEYKRGGLQRATSSHIKHNALGDAIQQAKDICFMWDKLLR